MAEDRWRKAGNKILDNILTLRHFIKLSFVFFIENDSPWRDITFLFLKESKGYDIDVCTEESL